MQANLTPFLASTWQANLVTHTLPAPLPHPFPQGVSLNELSGLSLTCTPSQQAANQCITNGESTISSLGLNYLNIGQCAGILISYIAICR